MQQIGKERVKLTFGEKLVQLRKQHRLSQDELAARLKVSRQAVSRWETGETMPETENVLGLSRLFQVSTDYLLKEELEEGPGQEEAISRAAQQTAAGQGAANHGKRILGIVLTALGIAGHLAIWVLSTMILVPVTREEVQPDGSVHYVGGGNVVGYEYWGFIEEYRLQAIFALLVAALAVGVFLLYRTRRAGKGKE